MKLLKRAMIVAIIPAVVTVFWIDVRNPLQNEVLEGRLTGDSRRSSLAKELTHPSQAKKTQNVPLKSALRELASSKIPKRTLPHSSRTQYFAGQGILIEDAPEMSRFLNDHFQLPKDTYHFAIAKQSRDHLGHKFYRFEQSFRGVPIFGSEGVAQVNGDGELFSVTAKDISVVTENYALAQRPERLGRRLNQQLMAKGYQDIRFEPLSRQIYYPHAVKGHALTEVFHLSGPSLSSGEVYVDANTGDILHFEPHTVAFQPDIYDLGGECLSKSLLSDFKNEKITPDTMKAILTKNPVSPDHTSESMAAAGRIRLAHWFFQHVFGQNSYDNQGSTPQFTINVKMLKEPKQFVGLAGFAQPGAFYFPQHLQPIQVQKACGGWYGGGWYDNLTDHFVISAGNGRDFLPHQSLDLLAHEYVHAFTIKSSGLLFTGEGGAIHESISDIFASAISAWKSAGGSEVGSGEEKYSPDFNSYLIGEDGFVPDTTFARRLYSPSLFGNVSVDHYSEYLRPNNQLPELPHENSGIFSLAFYLLAEGGKHPKGKSDIYVPAIGLEKAMDILYHSVRQTITPSTDLQSVRTYLTVSTTALFGQCSLEWIAVHRALDAVGIPGAADKECEQTYVSLTPPDFDLVPKKVSDISSGFIMPGLQNLINQDPATGLNFMITHVSPEFVFSFDEPTSFDHFQINYGVEDPKARDTWVLLIHDGKTWHAVHQNNGYGQSSRTVKFPKVTTSRAKIIFSGSPGIDHYAIGEISFLESEKPI